GGSGEQHTGFLVGLPHGRAHDRLGARLVHAEPIRPPRARGPRPAHVPVVVPRVDTAAGVGVGAAGEGHGGAPAQHVDDRARAGVLQEHDGGRALGHDRRETAVRERTDPVRPLRGVPLPSGLHIRHGRRLARGGRMFECLLGRRTATREDEDDGQRPEGTTRRQAPDGRRQAAGGEGDERRRQPEATAGGSGRARGATCASAALRATAHVGHHGDASGPRPRALGPRPSAHGLSRLCGPSAGRGKGEGRTYASVSSTWISTSTGASSGSTATPTALRAWTPLSPRTSASSSLAPLMTPGWPVKSGAEATKPTTFTTRATRSRSPATDLTAARAFSAHVRARF